LKMGRRQEAVELLYSLGGAALPFGRRKKWFYKYKLI
jgi:hypothetical protein